MDVPISHVVGTIALISLVVAAGVAYSLITSYIEVEVRKQQLNQIAEYVALNLVEIVNLVNFANFSSDPGTMMRILNLPSNLAYLIMLVDASGQGQGYYVYTQLMGREDVSARSLIPLNSTQTPVIFVVDSKGFLRVRGEDSRVIQYSSTVYGGAQDVVVWAWKKDDTATWAGIGLWKSQGG